MKRKLLLPIFTLFFAAMSCSLFVTKEPLTETDKLATLIAGTQTALSEQASLVLPGTETLPSSEAGIEPTMQNLLETPSEGAPVAESTLAPTETIDSGPPSQQAPGFSPDILRVVYATTSEVWTWSEDGNRQRVYAGEQVSDVLISPDGQVIVFFTQNENGFVTNIWRVNTDGSDLRILLNQAALNAFSTDPEAIGAGPAQSVFVPGTHTLAFNTRPYYYGPGSFLQDDLRLLDSDTGELRTLFDVGEAGGFVYSPDGSQIAISTPNTISLVNADGSNRRYDLLAFPRVITYSEYWYYPKPRWSPDGRQLRVVIPSEDFLGPQPSMSVWEIPLDGSPSWQLGVYRTDMALFNGDLALTPDLQRVAYMERVGPPEDNTWALHIANLDGSFDNILRTGSFRFEGWSPDATWHTLERDGDLFIGDISGGLWPLADHPPAVRMRWINASRFLYVSGMSSSWDLRLGDFSAPSISIAVSSAAYLPFDFTGGIR